MALAQAEARVTDTVCCLAQPEENLREKANYHSQFLRDAFLVDCAKRKEHHTKVLSEPLVLDETPLLTLSHFHRRIYEVVPPTPPVSPYAVIPADRSEPKTSTVVEVPTPVEP